MLNLQLSGFLSSPGGTNGSAKSESDICSIIQFVAASKPEFFVKNIALLTASDGKPISIWNYILCIYKFSLH